MSVSCVAIFALVAVTAAYPAKDEDSFYYGRLHDLANFNKEGRNLDAIDGRSAATKGDQDLNTGKGGGNLLRDLDLLRSRADVLSRSSRDQGEQDKKYHYMDPLMGNTIGLAKRYPFDFLRFGSAPADTNYDRFVKKNFDEIDRSGFGSFVKKNFDEIDRSGFGSFVKRSASPSAPEVPQ